MKSQALPREEFPVEEAGIEGLHQHVREFEARYSLETADFYARFVRGEIGDNCDFIVWAGLHELLQRMTAHTQPAVTGN